jgi:hypothetical protein
MKDELRGEKDGNERKIERLKKWIREKLIWGNLNGNRILVCQLRCSYG